MGRLERFTIEIAFICASEDKAGQEQKRSLSGLRRAHARPLANRAAKVLVKVKLL